ncbi:hypothetical protein MEX01_49190 [Methylorubrum extorquens]|nr:hypothetical protein MEX01_49190 [Methylorubrum extorquens]
MVVSKALNRYPCSRYSNRQVIYSPDFNPIETAFSKLKTLLRKAAEHTVEGPWSAAGRLVDTATPNKCADSFAAAGYEPE